MNINENTIDELLEEFSGLTESGASCCVASVTIDKDAVEIEGVDYNTQRQAPLAFITTETGREIPRLHGALDPRYGVQHEKPEHRMMVMLKAAGYSNKEIADQTGYSSPTVGYIMKQPWAEKMLLERVHGTADKAMKVLQDAAEEAALRLVAIAESAKNEEVKRKANNDILDRKYGKPNQPYTYNEKPAEDLSDAELAKAVQSN